MNVEDDSILRRAQHENTTLNNYQRNCSRNRSRLESEEEDFGGFKKDDPD